MDRSEFASSGAVASRRCVYTVLIGRYERLNEQPMAAHSGLPFICFTDDPELRSESWEIRRVPPLFGMDPVRSQRELKLRPHIHLPDVDASLYIDNSVLLTQPPELVFQRHFPSSGLCLPRHDDRDSVLDEFLEVARLGFDDQGRIFEQLNHYSVEFPEVLRERPWLTGIMLRDHRDSSARAMLEIWAAHVHRYSRRDQLSVNVALRSAGLLPDVMEIDIHESWFHTWPHAEGRDREAGMRQASVSFAPPVARIRQLELALVEQARQHEAERTTEREALVSSPTWRTAEFLAGYARRHPQASRATWLGLRSLRHATAFARRGRASEPVSRRESAADPGAGRPPAPAPPPADRVLAAHTIYVDPVDERGRELVRREGDLNPPTLRMWRRLLAAGSWTHVVDVGANYGEMLVNAKLPPQARIVAVEPNPRVLPYLERTLTEAGIDAMIVPSAVAERAGSAELLLDHLWSGKTRLAGSQDAAPADGLELVTVATTTLAGLLGSAGAGTGSRALVKIDVEGHEAGVLKGAVEVLDDLDEFVALTEVLRLEPSDLAWIIEQFEVQVLDLEGDRLVSVAPGTLARFTELLAEDRYYSNDVVLRRLGRGGHEPTS